MSTARDEAVLKVDESGFQGAGAADPVLEPQPGPTIGSMQRLVGHAA
jgi:hypothetical protein